MVAVVGLYMVLIALCKLCDELVSKRIRDSYSIILKANKDSKQDITVKFLP